MTWARLRSWVSASQRRQRMALLASLTPFWLALVSGALARIPLALLIGGAGLAAIIIAYQFVAIDFDRTSPEHWETSNEQ